MYRDKSCKVVAICGSSSGVGKSTLVNKLSEQIPDSVTLFFDAYHESTVYPENLFEDLIKGKEVHPSRIKNTIFHRDLVKLTQGEPIVDPWNRELKPAKCIIVEEPFGRSREGMKDLIDYVVCINLPLDIALARRLLRNLKVDFNHLTAEGKVGVVESFLNEYLIGGRIGYQKIYEMVSSNCDLLLDGQVATESMASVVIEKLNQLGILR